MWNSKNSEIHQITDIMNDNEDIQTSVDLKCFNNKENVCGQTPNDRDPSNDYGYNDNLNNQLYVSSVQ